MRDLIDIKYWIFDLDNTLYSGQTKVFSEVDKKMSAFISKKFDVDLIEAREIQKKFRKIYKKNIINYCGENNRWHGEIKSNISVNFVKKNDNFLN